MRVFPGLFLLAAALSVPAQVPSGSAPAQAPPPAAMTTYKNDDLHVTYSYPGKYKDATAIVGPAFQASVGKLDPEDKTAANCVTLPFSAMDASQGLAIVLLVRADAGCMKRTFTAAQLPEFTHGEVQGLSASGARTQFGEPAAFTTLAGHAAEVIRGTFELPTGGTLHAMVVCVLFKPDVGCWQFLANSDDQLRTMAAFPASVNGGTPAPLIPASVLAKP